MESPIDFSDPRELKKLLEWRTQYIKMIHQHRESCIKSTEQKSTETVRPDLYIPLGGAGAAGAGVNDQNSTNARKDVFMKMFTKRSIERCMRIKM